MNKLRLGLNGFELQYDADYGMDSRSGWSVVWDGSFVAELEPTLFGACWKAYKAIIEIESYFDEHPDER